MDSNPSPIHREEVRIEDFNKSIENWEIPKIQLKEIYKQSKLKLFRKSDYVIATKERTSF